MLTLDFRTNNPRWGIRGIIFSDLCEYTKTLGFLSNIRHYKGHGDNSKYFNNSISIHVEHNNTDGAWDKECRIHYYKDENYLKRCLPDLYKASSAGLGTNITCRINSNKFINYLINNYRFSVYGNGINYIKDVYPNDGENYLDDNESNYNKLKFELKKFGLDDDTINTIMFFFELGWEELEIVGEEDI
ncbi:hypothetical protein [Lachnoanaerobaculum orale]|mgnify:CR=1 FL=1|uniref:hypothetical protein n=1 Tax=Lachnoanaerobaculum orale TaxID=979627 RepID=UPI0023A800EF|nr:hypothetical protein [Lachnoanaerobaculum orale]